MSEALDIDAALPGGILDSDVVFIRDDARICSRCVAEIGEDDEILLLWRQGGGSFYRYCDSCIGAVP